MRTGTRDLKIGRRPLAIADAASGLGSRIVRGVAVCLVAMSLAAYYLSPAARGLATHAGHRLSLLWRQTSRALPSTLLVSGQPDELFVPTTSVRSGGFDVSLIAVGTLKSKESRPIVSDTYGTIVWTVEDGTRVKKGEPVVQLQNDMLIRQLQDKDTALANARQKLLDTKRDRTLEWENATTQYQKGQQELQILQAQNKSALEQAQAQLDFENTKLALARVQYSKDERLAGEKLVPQTQADADAAQVKSEEFNYEKGQGDLDLKKGQLASDELQKKQEVDRLKFAADMSKGRIDSEVKNAQLNIDTTQKQREDLTDQIKKSVIAAPADGIVILASQFDQGNFRPLRPGDQVGRNQKVCELPDLGHMQVTLEVQQKDIGPIRAGLPVRIHLDPFPDRVYHGRVAEVAAVAKPAQIEGSWWDTGTNTFSASIEIQETDPQRLRPGMNATLEIYSSHLDRVTYIPLEALFHDDNRPVVYLKRGLRFERRALVVGARSKDRIVVKRGVRPGEEIALVPPPSSRVIGGASGAKRRANGASAPSLSLNARPSTSKHGPV